MSAKAAREAIYARLRDTDWSAIPVAPEIVWQNTHNAGVRPRIEVAAAAENTQPLTLSDPVGMLSASIVLTAVGDVGEGEATLGPIVDAIIDRFPINGRIGDVMLIASNAAAPFVDGVEMRIPVRVRYRAVLQDDFLTTGAPGGHEW